MGHITLHRKSEAATSSRRYSIIIDNELYGTIENGATKKIHIEPGDHKMYLQIDWIKTQPIKFKITKSKDAHFECGTEVNLQEYIAKIIGISTLFVLIQTGINSAISIQTIPQLLAYLLIIIIPYIIVIRYLVFTKAWLYLHKTE